MTRPAPGFPRVAAYAANRGYGAPLLVGDVPNMDLITKLARYPICTLNTSPWYSVLEPSRPAVPLLLRRANPRICILGYQLLGWWYLGPDFTVAPWDKTFAGSWHTAIKETAGFDMKSGSGWFVRWDNPATESALTNLLCGAAASRLFNGLFFDYAWALNGVASAAMDRMIHAVRQAGGPGFLMLGNGPHADTLNLDGELREGYPDHLGNDFSAIRTWRAVRPHRSLDWLQSGTGFTSLDTPESQRAARFALGTSCLFGTLCSIGPDRDLTVQPSYMGWWLPEYDGGGIGTGWLGEPRRPAKTHNGLLWDRDFCGGAVVVNAGSAEVTVGLVPGYRLIDGTAVGTVTVGAMDSVFLVRAS